MSEKIARRNYRGTEETLPLLGFGCMRLPQISSDKPDIDYAKVREMIATAMKHSCNYFDTAYMYHSGLSESCIGELLQEYPRESYYLTDKMPVWFAKKEEDLEKIFLDQLQKCRTQYFDFYLLHCLDAENWALAEKFHAYEFLTEMKKQGKIRKLGFSFHDTPDVLQKIVDAEVWDFAQIQLNYLDWELYRSREQYEILEKAGLPVIVMEPLRGGNLARLPEKAAKILHDENPSASCASWGLRFAASLPNVLCVLSGMSSEEQMLDNMRTFSGFKPLSDRERTVLGEALSVYRTLLAVPCTACRYCLPCPKGLEIPRIFGLYNQYKVDDFRWSFESNYSMLPEGSRASDCISCGRCMKHCPQKIRIPDMMKKIAEEAKEK